MNRPTQLYRHFDEDGTLLYIGISLNTMSRLSQHKVASPWFEKVASVTIDHFDSRAEALKAEREAIQNENPPHNIHHKRNEIVLEKEAIETHAAHAEKSREELLLQRVLFHPIYQMGDAANALKISTKVLRALIEADEISAIKTTTRQYTNPETRESRIIQNYILTGWSIIDYLETLEVNK